MSSKKIVVVFGATGNQGGSVIDSILSDSRASNQFSVRGVTRDPTSSKAKALIAKGVECVKADLNSKDHLLEAFKGAYAVFAVTNYWEKQDPELEVQQGKNIADAAKEDGIQHLIWSSLLNISELTKGKFSHVDHFDSKANVEKYIRSIGIPASFFMPGWYMQNLKSGYLHPNPASPEHEFVFQSPNPPHTPIPLFDAADDTGKFVKGILLNREATLGKRIYAATDYYTCEQIMREFSEAKPEAGRNAHYEEVSPEAYKNFLMQVAGLNEVGAKELTENQQFLTEFGYYGGADLSESHKVLDEKPTTWKEFIAKKWPDLK